MSTEHDSATCPFCQPAPLRWSTPCSGPDLAEARRLAGHSARRLGELANVAASTVLRNENRPTITTYLQRRIAASAIGPFYWALMQPWQIQTSRSSHYDD